MPLRQLYPGAQSSDTHASPASQVDIIAVHGLNPRSKKDVEHAWDTWRSPAGPGGRLWLRDDLPRHLPASRVFLYQYNSTAVYGKDRSTFVDKANDLLEAIRVEQDSIVKNRPILFLGHSLGGLLIKQALINAQNNPKYTHIKRTTKGIAFFATPHKGGSNILVGIGDVLAKIALELGFQKGDNLIETLREDSVFSNTMHDLWRQQSLEYDIVSFWGSSDKVVPRESARFGLPGDRENAVTLNADHRTVCKFGEQETDLDNLKLVCANLKDLYWHALEDYSSKSDSFTTLNCDPSLDKQLPLWLFDPQAEESQKQREEYLRCDACHDKSDEFLLGVSNTSIFHTWASRSGSSLWCQNPESNAASDHANIAACVMKHTLALNGPPVDENSTKRLPSQVLYYKCTTTSPGLVPEEYGDQLEDSELQTNFQQTVDETESQMFAPELMLRAFIAQICGRDQSALLAEYHKGPESPETAFQTLKRIFAALLCQKNGRLFLVVDELHLPQFRIADIVEILALMATPNPSLPNLECSVLLGGKPIPWLSQQLQGIPAISLASELQECCQSLAVPGIQTRRDEIAPTIEGTNEWIWNHPKFASWRDQPGDCLAIVGKPGSGKSVLAKHIVTTLQGHSSFQHTPPNEPAPGTGQAGLLSSWFYSKRSGEQFVKHQVLLQAVLHEFLAQQPELFDVYKETYRAASPSPQRSWTMDELVELLKRLAESPQHVLIVIDAVDEASDDSILQLVESLCQISGSHMKFLVVTRPVRLLERRFWKSRKITVQEENRKDIYEVVLKRCETLRRLMHGIDVDIDVHTETDDSEPDEDDIIMDAYIPNEATGQQKFEQAQNWETFELQQLCDGIIEQSDGVMLWVLLVFDLLNMAVAREGFLSLAEIRERAKRMPSELDEFYTQFIQDLQQRRDKNGLTKVRHALMWISAASEIKPFTLGELWDALAVPSSKEIEANDYQNASYSLIERNRIPAKSWSELRRIIEKLCGPFVEVIQVLDQDGQRSGTAATSIIQLMHQTAREFLMHSENAGSLAFTPEEAAALIQGAASRYINIALPLSYSTYAPVPFRSQDVETTDIAKAAQYLEKQPLVRFCATLAANDGVVRAAIQDHAQLAVMQGFLRFEDIRDSETEHPSNGNEQGQNVTQNSSLSPLTRRIIIGFFREATRRGFPSAVTAMLSLSAHVDGWWQSAGHSVRHAALFTVFECFLRAGALKRIPEGQDLEDPQKSHPPVLGPRTEARKPQPGPRVPLSVRQAVQEIAEWGFNEDTNDNIKVTDGAPQHAASAGPANVPTDGLVALTTRLLQDIWPDALLQPTQGAMPLDGFVRDILRRSRADYSAIQLALYYLALLKTQTLECAKSMEELKTRGEIEFVHDPRRMFLTSLRVALKMLEDRNYSVRAWTKICGLPSSELLKLELVFLNALQWNLHVSPQGYGWWVNMLDHCFFGTWTDKVLWGFLDRNKG